MKDDINIMGHLIKVNVLTCISISGRAFWLSGVWITESYKIWEKNVKKKKKKKKNINNPSKKFMFNILRQAHAYS